MAYRFTDPAPYAFQKGALFLGRDEGGREIGIKTERHAITIAGARSGKGACQIIPNLLRWDGNSLTIDPSGENVAATWESLEASGRKVVLLDPFHIAEREYNVPARLRVSVNLLDTINAESLTVREDIRVIADGLVKRYKVEDGTWDNGAVSVLAGMIAYVAAQPEPEDRTLSNVRFLLTMGEETRESMFAEMHGQTGFGNLARAAATIGLSKSKKNQEFVGGALDHTEWIDSEPMAALLGSSTFSLAELKSGDVAAFLVLPHEYINEHSRFLRLFVRAAIDAMTKGKGGKRCLFLLDEFFSLGTIDEIAKAAGALPKFGVVLWPFLQDLGQLQQMYGQTLTATFFGNSDAACYFGNTDALTLDVVSRGVGPLTIDEIGAAPMLGEFDDSPFGQQCKADWEALYANRLVMGDNRNAEAFSNPYKEKWRNAHSDEVAKYNHVRAAVGSPRLSPSDVAALVGRGNTDKVARSMIVFAKQGDILNLKLAPYFEPAPAPAPVVAPVAAEPIAPFVFGEAVESSRPEPVTASGPVAAPLKDWAIGGGAAFALLAIMPATSMPSALVLLPLLLWPQALLWPVYRSGVRGRALAYSALLCSAAVLMGIITANLIRAAFLPDADEWLAVLAGVPVAALVVSMMVERMPSGTAGNSSQSTA